jgi:hypothetical protein
VSSCAASPATAARSRHPDRCQDRKITAVGTASSPIIFTTAAVDDAAAGLAADGTPDNYTRYTPGATFLDATPHTAPLYPMDAQSRPNIALWGGLILLGDAPVNVGKVTTGVGDEKAGVCNIEGLEETENTEYGGFNPYHSNGTLSYVSIRHGGDQIGEGNEVNGLTLGGVGSGTKIDHVEVYCTYDDGIEVFGGTVNLSYCAVVFCGDDGFDFDQGYTGLGQFLFYISGNFTSAFGTSAFDNACEWDGDDAGERGGDGTLNGDLRPIPFSNPVVYNLTSIGTTAYNKGRVLMRNGFNGVLANSVVVNTGSLAALNIGSGGFTGYSATNNINAGTTYVAGTTFDDVPAADADVNSAQYKATHAAGHAVSVFNTALSLVDEEFLYTEDNSLNPRPQGLPANYAASEALLNHPFFRSVGYRGAFAAGGEKLWTTGWTAANALFLVD